MLRYFALIELKGLQDIGTLADILGLQVLDGGIHRPSVPQQADGMQRPDPMFVRFIMQRLGQQTHCLISTGRGDPTHQRIVLPCPHYGRLRKTKDRISRRHGQPVQGQQGTLSLFIIL